jgi:hypothetical protein
MRKLWTDAERAYLREHFPHRQSQVVADEMGRSLKSVRAYANLLDLHKTQAFYDDPNLSGRLSSSVVRDNNMRFKKGQTGFNKGKKQHEYMSAEAIERCKKGQFKKGNIPPNTSKYGDGAITVRKTHGVPYNFIRVSLGKWIQLAHFNWAQVNSEVPKDMVLRHIDGNTLNDDISNLELITLVENMRRNSIANIPEELKEITYMMIALKSTITRQTKKRKRHEQ